MQHVIPSPAAPVAAAAAAAASSALGELLTVGELVWASAFATITRNGNAGMNRFMEEMLRPWRVGMSMELTELAGKVVDKF